MTTTKNEPVTGPKTAEPKGLTEADVRAIVQSELAKSGGKADAKTVETPGGWKHDANHSADAVRLNAQRSRDGTAGLTPEETKEKLA